MTASEQTVKVGAAAPDFVLQTQTGAEIRLADFLGKQVVVLFFYPRDGTRVCTREVCAFRDAFADFSAAGAVVIGVSADDQASHAAFAAEHQLPFYLASDSGNTVRKRYGAAKALGLLPARVTFVIDKQGIVRLMFSALLTADQHITEALQMVNQLVHEDGTKLH